MKKLLIAVVSIAIVSAAFAGITDTKHDFSGAGWSGGTICQPCHTPHNSMDVSSQAPLWNHELSSQTFTVYGNGSGTLLGTSVTQPGTNSLLCLGCHDGNTSMDNYGGVTASGNEMGAVDGNFGTDLQNDHPIGIVYGGTAKGLWSSPTAAGIKLYAGNKVECGSCHNVHEYDADKQPFLRVSPSASALCLACHNK